MAWHPANGRGAGPPGAPLKTLWWKRSHVHVAHGEQSHNNNLAPQCWVTRVLLFGRPRPFHWAHSDVAGPEKKAKEGAVREVVGRESQAVAGCVLGGGILPGTAGGVSVPKPRRPNRVRCPKGAVALRC